MVEVGGVVLIVVVAAAVVVETGGLVVVPGEDVVAPLEDETFISVHPENQNPAKSQSQNTVYIPAAKFEGRVTYASVTTPS